MQKLSFFRWTLCFFLLSGCAAMEKVGTMIGDDDMVKASAEMTPRQEYYLGRSVAANILTESPLVKKKMAHDYLNTLGQYLAMHTNTAHPFKGFHFGLIKSKVPSAVSAPSGYVFVSTALLKDLKDEDELAAVLAHEIAHIDLKHAADSIKSNAAMKSFSKVGSFLLVVASKGDITQDQGDAFGEVVSNVVDIKFSKDQESEADEVAMKILHSAGYDPSALLGFVSRLDTKADLLSRHPRNDARIEDLRENLQKLPWSGSRSARQKRFDQWKKKYASL